MSIIKVMLLGAGDEQRAVALEQVEDVGVHLRGISHIDGWMGRVEASAKTDGSNRQMGQIDGKALHPLLPAARTPAHHHHRLPYGVHMRRLVC